MRLHIFNLLFLLFNIMLTIFLVFRLLLPLDQSIARARKDASELGMDIYFVKSPFSIFVDKDFPNKYKYVLFEYDQPLIISANIIDEKDSGKKREVNVTLGTDFSITCIYSVDNGIIVNELSLFKKNDALFDLNADGFIDKHLTLFPEKRLDVRYKGDWHEVTQGEGISKYQVQLKSGKNVSFDIQRGLWLSLEDRSESGINKGKITNGE